MRPYQVCQRCVMDTSDAQIEFTPTGVCDHCLTFDRSIEPRWRAQRSDKHGLEEMVGRIKRDAAMEYDCLIGISGGVDSSYLAYLATKRFGLRPLLFHVDTGWNSTESVSNVETLVDELGLDLVTEVVDWDEMKDLQLSFIKAGVPHIDAPQDHAIFASLYRFAEKNNVRNILTGGNYSTECIRNPVQWMYFQSDDLQLRDIHSRFGSKPLRSFPTTNILWHKVFLPVIKRISVTRLLDWVEYRRQEAVDLLSREIGWQAYPQKHFESRFTAFYEGFWLYNKFGYDVRRVQFSSLILTGQLTRDEAIERLSTQPMDDATSAREFVYVASKLGIEPALLQQLFDSQNRSYMDYRSRAWLYKLGSLASRAAGLERGGKR